MQALSKWTDKLSGYCACLERFPENIFVSVDCTARCPAQPLRDQFLAKGPPSKIEFTKNLIRTGTYSRKEIIAILRHQFKITYNTSSRKVDTAQRQLKKEGLTIYRDDRRNLVAAKVKRGDV